MRVDSAPPRGYRMGKQSGYMKITEQEEIAGFQLKTDEK
jgi:hypothetical protein